ncbi:MAG: glycoside hydrolase family 3 C-terminal domain-containing protein [Clostridia bacterium]|nr:glycoside hydrolase family 3 C-terminal domain-containing protein [Clostridia bacterium]
MEKYVSLSKKVAAGGCVLLKNDGTLPVSGTVAVYGRGCYGYITAGSGSGGSVNIERNPDFFHALVRHGTQTDSVLREYYDTLNACHPLIHSDRWNGTPISWDECGVPDKVIEKIDPSATAIVYISRYAGEDRDMPADKGGYYLNDGEEALLAAVCSHHKKVAVCLNISGIIDMSFVDKYNVGALLIAFPGGEYGDDAVAEVILGERSPYGKLPMTIPISLADHPADRGFYENDKVIYHDDIYVGYRYFTTADKPVRFPFGYGLTYTSFDNSATVRADRKNAVITVESENTGTVDCESVIEIYMSYPECKPGTPKRVLCAFTNLGIIKTGEKRSAELYVDTDDFAIYDEYGDYEKNAFILPHGNYTFYLGNSADDTTEIGSITLKNDITVEKTNEALAPVEEFDVTDIKNGVISSRVPALRTANIYKRIADARPSAPEYTGDRGWKFVDYKSGHCTADEFAAQLNEEELMTLIQGEGMSSPKVRPGTGCAFGGVSDRLAYYGIPLVCSSDGPTGVRIDSGEFARCIPSATTIACGFDTAAAEELLGYCREDLDRLGVGALLAPGMNIQRHPLCGRNFEYYSEDPFLSGMLGAAATRGLDGRCTIKHFAANNKESNRNYSDSLVSQRALREIYLRNFRLAIKYGNVTAVMTAYNMINGISCAGNHDLCTVVLRDEWKFDGVIYSDWWTKANFEGERGVPGNLCVMVRSGNDMFMVTPTAGYNQTLHDYIENGTVTLYELRRNAKRILKYLTLPMFDGFEVYNSADVPEPTGEPVMVVKNVLPGKVFTVENRTAGKKTVRLTFDADVDDMTQLTVKVLINGACGATVTTNVAHGASALRTINVKPCDYEFGIECDDRIKVKMAEIYG